MKNTPAIRDEKAVTLAVDPAASALSVQDVLGQIALIQQVMQKCMIPDQHYGRIPGCGDKPTLLKPGAEKLCLTFRMAPTYEVEEKIGERGHREYRVQCALTSILGGAFIGQGVGICSTMEAKYRFRAGAAEVTDRAVPRAYWDLRQEDPAKAQEIIGGKGFSVKKVDGQGWMIAKGGEKVENDNPADCYNTVLKMAKKRALVDAVLTATAASDIFTQDLEDITANLAAHAPRPEPPDEPPAAAAALPAPAPTPVPTATAVDSIDDAPEDFRETRVHFGKSRGLMLSELTPQQVHWYETDWLPKKEAHGPVSIEDRLLINALKAYRDWRGGQARAVDWRAVTHHDTPFGKMSPVRLLEVAIQLADAVPSIARTPQEEAKVKAAYLGVSTHIRSHPDRKTVNDLADILEGREECQTPDETALFNDAVTRLKSWPVAHQ